ncbi:MAG: hypothetical protein NXI27_00925 [Alphaproteobacteria bacterium]|nr:hypothetical protein [Alphaproteobacteria bacterium]
MIFTVFCGLLIYLPFVILALSRGEKQATKIIILLVGGVFSLTSQFVVAALGYPHYEIVFIGASGALYLTLFAKRYWLALLLASMMVLSREDGGFYVAYAALCALFTQSAGILHPASRPLYGFILIGVLLSLCILAAKAVYFPGFATVEGNFIGDGFSHLTMGLIAKRIQNLFESAGTLPFLLLLPIVALRFPRATIPFLLMLPLVFLHLISVREVIGNFELHYGIPFAVIMIVMLIQILDSLERSGNKALDLSVVVLLVVVSSAPFAAGFDLRNQSGSYFYWIFWRDWPNRDYLDDQRFIRQTVATQTGVTCGSIGVLALEPDLFAVDDFIRDSVHDHCDGLLLYENDLAYDRLRPIVEAEGFYLVGSINKSLHFQKE